MRNVEPAIIVNNVTKKFRVHIDRNITLKDKFIRIGQSKFRDYIALQDVDFQVSRGSTVGLIGSNGSGKSTLLKIISKILYPDKGSVTVNGRISSLLELGAGFHPEFSGLENIYLNASLLGLTRKEIDSKIDKIIEFSELGDFIGEPIRSYSSGMHMRLAFSVAVAVEPEILILDEILAVGDVAFQTKCLSRIRQMQKDNVTIVIVSHDTSTIEKYCDSVVWLQDSRVKMVDNPQTCVPKYLSTIFRKSNEGNSVMSFSHDIEEKIISKDDQKLNPKSKIERGELIKSVSFSSDLGNNLVSTGQKAVIEIGFKPERDFPNAAIGVAFRTEDNKLLWGTNSFMDRSGIVYLKRGEERKFSLVISEMPLASGTYVLDVGSHSDIGEHYDYWPACLKFKVISESLEVGSLRIKHAWALDEKEKSYAL